MPITPDLNISIVGNSIAISSAPSGTNIIAYIPTSSIGTGQQANTTFVYFMVDNCDSHCEGVYEESCNLVCNPSLSTECTPVYDAPNWEFDNICFPECTNFPGWESAAGRAHYYATGFNAPTQSGVAQIDNGLTYSTMLGFRAGEMTTCTDADFRGAALAANIELQGAGNYVLSFYNTLDPLEASTNSSYNQQLNYLDELHVALVTDVALSSLTPCSAQSINCQNFDPSQAINIYTQTNLQGSTWQHAIQCFNLPNNGTDYSLYAHLLVYGVLRTRNGITSLFYTVFYRSNREVI